MSSIDEFDVSDGSSPVMAAIGAIATLDWRHDAAPSASLESLEQFGRYHGLPPKLELLSDGRLVRLLEAIIYTGADGVQGNADDDLAQFIRSSRAYTVFNNSGVWPDLPAVAASRCSCSPWHDRTHPSPGLPGHHPPLVAPFRRRGR